MSLTPISQLIARIIFQKAFSENIKTTINAISDIDALKMHKAFHRKKNQEYPPTSPKDY